MNSTFPRKLSRLTRERAESGIELLLEIPAHPQDRASLAFFQPRLENPRHLHGYEPIIAHQGREGLQKIAENDSDPIVLEVMMPKKTGFVPFKELSRHGEHKDIPILMLAGISASLAELDELDEREDDTFERPCQSLREALRKMIQEIGESGKVRLEMFVDKPVASDAFGAVCAAASMARHLSQRLTSSRTLRAGEQ